MSTWQGPRLTLQSSGAPPPPPGHAPAGQGGQHRGYDVAPAKGLFMHAVHYPPEVDDPTKLLYPALPHDEWGRLLGGVPGRTMDDE